MSIDIHDVAVRFDPILRTDDGKLKIKAVLPNGAMVEGVVNQGTDEEIALQAAQLEPTWHHNGGGLVHISKAAFEAAVAKGAKARATRAAVTERLAHAEETANALSAINNAAPAATDADTSTESGTDTGAEGDKKPAKTAAPATPTK